MVWPESSIWPKDTLDWGSQDQTTNLVVKYHKGLKQQLLLYSLTSFPISSTVFI